MRYEIAIEGPFFALLKLYHELRRFSPTLEKLPQRPKRKTNWGRMSFVETNVALLNANLLEINRIISHVEKVLSLKERLDIRIRNLSYSEPYSGSSQFNEPFEPIPSITILPWKPTLPEVTDSFTIVLDPEHAFGSGKHPSTRLCLSIMNRIMKDKTHAQKLQRGRLLDFGCGTGILAIAAVKMGVKSAVGVEIDASAAESAETNVVLNHLSHKIDIRVGSWNVVNETYDLIVSNLVVSALLRTGKKISDHLEGGGLAVIAGFGENQLIEMKGFFAKIGLIPIGQNTLEQWAALTLKKK
jgi:ribosomal protein L11 methyltransferase